MSMEDHPAFQNHNPRKVGRAEAFERIKRQRIVSGQHFHVVSPGNMTTCYNGADLDCYIFTRELERWLAGE